MTSCLPWLNHVFSNIACKIGTAYYYFPTLLWINEILYRWVTIKSKTEKEQNVWVWDLRSCSIETWNNILNTPQCKDTVTLSCSKMIITHFFHYFLNRRASVHNIPALGAGHWKAEKPAFEHNPPNQFPGPQLQKAPRSAQQYSKDLTMNVTNTLLALHAHPSCDAWGLTAWGTVMLSVSRNFQAVKPDKFASVRESDTM